MSTSTDTKPEVEATGRDDGTEIKSGDSSDRSCIDEIECYPRQYDCRNNPTVSESYNKFEQDMISIFQKELQKTKESENQQKILIEQQATMTQEQYDNKLSTAKLLIKQMNYHHHLQEQKYMNEIQSLRELLNRSEGVWQSRIDKMDQQLQTQQTKQYAMISEMKSEIQQYKAQNDIFAKESQTSTLNFENARTELNDLIQSNQVIIKNLESKVIEQSKDVSTFRSDTTAEKEEMELMVQSWMTQCEALQQEVHNVRNEMTKTNETVQSTATIQDTIQTSINKMGQTYEKVFENVMEQIQEQSEIQVTNYNQLQAAQTEIRTSLEQFTTTTTGQFQQIDETLILHDKRITSLQSEHDTLNNTVTTVQQTLDNTTSQVTKMEDTITEHFDKHTTVLREDVTGIQGIVAKLADASNNRFVRMEKSVETEVKSIQDVKETMMAAIENSLSRVKSVDNKINIHSIQLGEITKEVKDMNTSIVNMKNHHQETIESIHKDCEVMLKQININHDNQNQLNGAVDQTIKNLQATVQDVEQRTSTIEKISDTMSNRIEQMDTDHTTTRGNFMEQHKSIESNVSEQVRQLFNQIQKVENSTHENVRSTATSIEKLVNDHGIKLNEHDANFGKLNALTHSAILTIQEHTKKHQLNESDIKSIQKDLDGINQKIQKVDENQTTKLKDHIVSTKSQLDEIVKVTIPKQSESSNLLRVRIVESESRMKEMNEKSSKAIHDRVNQIQDSFNLMKGSIDSLSQHQEDAKVDRASMKQGIETIINDMNALNGAFSLEVAHISELKSKLSDVESSIKVRTAEIRQLESELETHVTKTGEHNEQHTKDLNQSLAQIMNLLHLKEVMMQQINDCLTHLSALDGTTAEHNSRLVEMSKLITDHDTKFDAFAEESQIKNSDAIRIMENYKAAFDALTYDVKKQCEVQKGVNDFVSQSIATCTISTQKMEKRTDSVTSTLDTIVKNLDDHIKIFTSHTSDTKAAFDQHDEKYKLLESKIMESEVALRNHHENTTRDLESQILSSINEVKTKLDRHTDRLKTAKDARIVIRNDLKQLVDTMNEQLSQVRSEIEASKATIASNLDIIVQTRDDIVSKMNDSETESKLEYVAGKIKSIDDKSKAFKETITRLQEEVEHWRNKSEQEMLTHVATLASKIEALDVDYKSLNDNSKSTHESLHGMKEDIKKCKKEQRDIGIKINIVEEISTKIDYLAGKFKSISENLKLTNTTLTALQETVDQLGEKQHDTEQAIIAGTTASRNSNDKHDAILQEFQELKQSFETLKDVLNSKKNSDKDQESIQGNIDDLKKQIDFIVQQVESLESDQSTKLDAAPLVEQIKIDIDRLSNQIDHNNNALQNTDIAYRNLLEEVNGIKNRQTMYKNTIIKRHGQMQQIGKEMMSTSPIKKRIIPDTAMVVAKDDEEEVYHEARDTEDSVPLSKQILDHREQE